MAFGNRLYLYKESIKLKKGTNKVYILIFDNLHPERYFGVEAPDRKVAWFLADSRDYPSTSGT